MQFEPRLNVMFFIQNKDDFEKYQRVVKACQFGKVNCKMFYPHEVEQDFIDSDTREFFDITEWDVYVADTNNPQFSKALVYLDNVHPAFRRLYRLVCIGPQVFRKSGDRLDVPIADYDTQMGMLPENLEDIFKDKYQIGRAKPPSSIQNPEVFVFPDFVPRPGEFVQVEKLYDKYTFNFTVYEDKVGRRFVDKHYLDQVIIHVGSDIYKHLFGCYWRVYLIDKMIIVKITRLG